MIFVNIKSDRKAQARRGFTLIELLVTIGIIVLLIALGIPAIFRAYRSAAKTRTAADLQIIGTALEAYKADFGDYPRFDSDNSANSLNVQQDRGARILCRALLAPGPETITGAGTVDFKGTNVSGTGQAPDGALGPGFRVRPGGAGKVYGPYLQNDKFKLGNSGVPTPSAWDSISFTDATLLDPQDHPILYYPATPGGTATVSIKGAHVATFNPNTGKNLITGVATPYPLVNAFDNACYGTTSPSSPPSPNTVFLSQVQLQTILGERSSNSRNNGFINTTAMPAEANVVTQPYLLWTSGADGIYGLDANGKTDDVTNFDIPSYLAK